ncbi:MAG: undecaprenyl/decaprenyl-phosphate alpha-N-acetylglucosaminyl 1-phosphate transferase [Phycisphaerales bacterium]|nr:undecaprenyl/decaprenyl-phosphate alpha-N-acetylglucosaminyl 1-phosphate transferase [Phycisphaerales bacterium]
MIQEAAQLRVPENVASRVEGLGKQVSALADQVKELARVSGIESGPTVTRLEVFHGYIAVFVVAFVVTLLATPLVRRLALSHGIIDRPTEGRKAHRLPVAYLGGVAVFLGIIAGILYSYLATAIPGLMGFHPTRYLVDESFHHIVPFSVLLGLTVIMLVGLLDDVVGIPPRVKLGGQLVAAAALAYDDVGVRVAAGLLLPLGQLLGNERLLYVIQLPFPVPGIGTQVQIDVVYWAGTALIAVFVLGACNASNLIDGLDGLATGVTAIAASGFLFIALTLAMLDDGPRDAQRIILCLSLLGACLGFLPHNFNPATIFLGDCGSLLLGFCSIVIVLTFGDRGFTYLVIAGLVIYALPIVDTILAIIRRRMAGRAISDADDQHLHHMLKRALGVKGAVLTLYGMGAVFAVLGVAMSLFRARVVYVVALVAISFLIVTAVKMARRKALDEQALHYSRAAPTRRREPATVPPGEPPQVY